MFFQIGKTICSILYTASLKSLGKRGRGQNAWCKEEKSEVRNQKTEGMCRICKEKKLSLPSESLWQKFFVFFKHLLFTVCCILFTAVINRQDAPIKYSSLLEKKFNGAWRRIIQVFL